MTAGVLADDGVLAPPVAVVGGVYSRWKRWRRPSKDEVLELVILIIITVSSVL